VGQLGDLAFATRSRAAIGFTTAEVNERTDLRPLNLVFVIDKSGSMAGDKMARVKDGLRAMISKLRADDIVSIVAFDTNRRVFIPGARDRRWFGVETRD
jgi:Ca-activated chloride channel family protein